MFRKYIYIYYRYCIFYIPVQIQLILIEIYIKHSTNIYLIYRSKHNILSYNAILLHLVLLSICSQKIHRSIFFKRHLVINTDISFYNMDIMADTFSHLKCSSNFDIKRYGWLITAIFSYKQTSSIMFLVVLSYVHIS